MADEKQRPAAPQPAPARTGKAAARSPTLGERVGLKLAPVFLRLALGLATVWAGAAMLMADLPVSGAQAEVLRSLGILGVPGASPAPTPDEQPTLPRTDSEPAGAGQPESPRTEAPPKEPAGATGMQTVRQVHAVTLRVYEGAVGQVSGEGATRRTLPAAAADRPWPSVIAHAVMSIELVAGFFVLIGFLTRISAWLLALVIGAWVWVADIGPAVAWGRTWLGFVPAYENFGFVGSGGAAYEGLLLHASMLAAALSLAFLGSGAVSADRLLGARR